MLSLSPIYSLSTYTIHGSETRPRMGAQGAGGLAIRRVWNLHGLVQGPEQTNRGSSAPFNTKLLKRPEFHFSCCLDGDSSACWAMWVAVLFSLPTTRLMGAIVAYLGTGYLTTSYWPLR